jgi:hypothetical protein
MMDNQKINSRLLDISRYLKGMCSRSQKRKEALSIDNQKIYSQLVHILRYREKGDLVYVPFTR